MMTEEERAQREEIFRQSLAGIFSAPNPLFARLQAAQNQQQQAAMMQQQQSVEAYRQFATGQAGGLIEHLTALSRNRPPEPKPKVEIADVSPKLRKITFVEGE